MSKVFINGIEKTELNVNDRGFQYGDGLFETIAFRQNKLQFIDAHFQRLREGCARLSIDYINEALWLNDIMQCALKGPSIIKLIVSRGVSARGYKCNNSSAVTRVTMASDMPEYPLENRHGINAIICKTSASINTALAGIKHLNRLENVLARQEWNDKNITEGFLFNHLGYLIEGTMSNVFCVQNNTLYTPELNLSGVAGIMRAQIIELAKKSNVEVYITNITKLMFLQMEAVFITNSLIGLWPVKQIGDTVFKTHEIVEFLQNEMQGKCRDSIPIRNAGTVYLLK